MGFQGLKKVYMVLVLWKTHGILHDFCVPGTVLAPQHKLPQFIPTANLWCKILATAFAKWGWNEWKDWYCNPNPKDIIFNAISFNIGAVFEKNPWSKINENVKIDSISCMSCKLKYLIWQYINREWAMETQCFINYMCSTNENYSSNMCWKNSWTKKLSVLAVFMILVLLGRSTLDVLGSKSWSMTNSLHKCMISWAWSLYGRAVLVYILNSSVGEEGQKCISLLHCYCNGETGLSWEKEGIVYNLGGKLAALKARDTLFIGNCVDSHWIKAKLDSIFVAKW